MAQNKYSTMPAASTWMEEGTSRIAYNIANFRFA